MVLDRRMQDPRDKGFGAEKARRKEVGKSGTFGEGEPAWSPAQSGAQNARTEVVAAVTAVVDKLPTPTLGEAEQALLARKSVVGRPKLAAMIEAKFKAGLSLNPDATTETMVVFSDGSFLTIGD